MSCFTAPISFDGLTLINNFLKVAIRSVAESVSMSIVYIGNVMIFCYILNRHCTYQAELSEGSEQEKAAYVLNTKQKVVKLIGQWVALYGLLLKEDVVALDFLEVRQ